MNGLVMSQLSIRHGAQAEETASPDCDRPVDLVHLSRQSLGDRALEKELLQLFDAQAESIMVRLASEIGMADRRWRRDMAHTLRGSASAVGARHVAACASAYEEALFSSASDRELRVLLDHLVEAVGAARAMIVDLLADEA